MTHPTHVCRWCGSDRFVESGVVEWNVRAANGETRHTRAVTGTLVVCLGCGLLETFIDDPRDLVSLPAAREVHVDGQRVDLPYREHLPSGESPAGSGWQVVLVHAGEQPIGVISELRKDLPMSFASARESISRLPWVLTRTSNRRIADQLSEKLEALGAVVRIEPTHL